MKNIEKLYKMFIIMFIQNSNRQIKAACRQKCRRISNGKHQIGLCAYKKKYLQRTGCRQIQRADGETAGRAGN